MNSSLQVQVEQRLDWLLYDPAAAANTCVREITTLDDVRLLACTLLARYREEPAGRPVCLGVTDRAAVAAALLATVMGGPPILLPPAFSGSVLAAMQDVTGFQVAVVDRNDLPWPEKVRLVDIRDFGGGPFTPPRQGARDLDRELLRIFTGGSSGTPRIWSKSVYNIFAEGLFLADHFDITSQDRLVATLSPYHIYGLLFSVVLPLVSGATVADATPMFPVEIRDWIKKYRATVLAAVPAHYRGLCDRPLEAPGLRLACSSAGMLNRDDAFAFHHHNGIGITEVYGSTETGGIASRNQAEGQTCFVPFGPVQWTCRHGLLALRSPFLSAELACDRQGFFLTGDRIEPWDEQSFQLIGRIDGIVKVGGKRVDLEEVRTVISKYAGVEDCVALALPTAGGRGNLVAALVQGRHVEQAELQRFLKERLEPAARPRRIRVVERLPLTSRGKYDRTTIIRLLDDRL